MSTGTAMQLESDAGSSCETLPIDRSKATLHSVESQQQFSKTTVELPTWLKRRQRNHVCRRWQMSTNFLGRLRQCKLVVVQPLDNHLFLPGKTPGLEMPSTPSVMFHGIISDGCRLAPLECHPHADFAITFATFN